jgi:hypothetical protein
VVATYTITGDFYQLNLHLLTGVSSLAYNRVCKVNYKLPTEGLALHDLPLRRDLCSDKDGEGAGSSPNKATQANRSKDRIQT